MKGLSAKRLILLFLLLLLVFIKASQILMIVTSFVPIQEEYNLNNTQLGAITTMYYLFSLIGTSYWLLISGNIDRYRMYFFGGSIWLVGLLLTALNKEYWQLIVGVVVIGFGADSITMITLNYYSYLIKSDNRSKALSLFYIIQGSGGLFGIFIAGLLEDVYEISWHALMFYVALVTFIILLLLFILLHNIPSDFEDLDTNINENTSELFFQPMNEKVSKKLLKDTLSNKINLWVFIGLCILIPINSINNVWLQKYWIEIHGLSQIMASISLIFTSGGEFLGLMVGGWLLDKISKKKKRPIGYLGIISGLVSAPLMALGYILNWNMNSTPIEGMNFIEICLYMLRVAISDPLIFISYSSLFFGFLIIQLSGSLFLTSIIQYNEERTRALAINIVLVIINAACFVAPIMGGFLADLFNFKVLLMVVPFVHAIYGLIYVKIYRIMKKRKRLF